MKMVDASKDSRPRQRFPEFRKMGNWKKYKVGNLFTATRGEVLAMSKVQAARTEACPYPVYSSQTKNRGLAGFYSKYLYEDAITWTTDGANAGDVNYREGKFFCTNVCGVLLSKDGYCNKCVSEIINSVSKKYVSYVGNPKLMNNVMKEIEIFIPSLPEQQKIADCLSSLDELIEAHEQKRDALMEHKKGLMQRLFPAEGETTPQWRFPEFRKAAKWKKEKLGKLLIGRPEYGVNAPAVPYSSDLPTYIRITDISDGGTFIKDKKMSVDIDPNPNFYLQLGDIVFARTGASVGKSYKFRQEDGQLVFAGFLIRVRPDSNKLNSDYLFHYLSTSQYWKWVQFMSMRSGQPGINGAEYASLTLPMCSLPEQQKIADCLSSLDARIEAEEAEIASLREHRQGLMQQLFPQNL